VSTAATDARHASRTEDASLRRRVPPHDLEAERAVLSAILLDNAAIHEVATELAPDDFYSPAHQTIYQAMLSLDHDSRPVDLITLSEYLNARKALDRVGGPVALAEIADFEATAANITYYARIVRDRSVKRALIGVATEIAGMGYEYAGSANQLLDEAESKVFSLGEEKANTTLSPLHVQMHQAVDHLEMLRERSGELTGLPTGFRNLDELTGGLQEGELIVLAARPSMGKTALALNIARNAAVEHGKSVAVFSLEMTARALVLRMLSSEAEFDFDQFRKGLISTHAYDKLIRVAGELAEAKIWIDDAGRASIMEMRAKCRRLRAKHGLDLVIVDYLQLAHGDARTDSREQEISEISRGLKALAKELSLPVLALSQLNRGPETRKAEDKRPLLADLRESGAIEQDADVIGFIYRDVVYHRETQYPDLAELIIAKQRNGPTDTVRLKFEGRYARFRDWSQDDFGGAGYGPSFVGPGADDPDAPF
jgi:replicative DNA helicase